MRNLIIIFLLFLLATPVVCCKGDGGLKIEEQEQEDKERGERQAKAIDGYANFPVQGGFIFRLLTAALQLLLDITYIYQKITLIVPKTIPYLYISMGLVNAGIAAIIPMS